MIRAIQRRKIINNPDIVRFWSFSAVESSHTNDPFKIDAKTNVVDWKGRKGILFIDGRLGDISSNNIVRYDFVFTNYTLYAVFNSKFGKDAVVFGGTGLLVGVGGHLTISRSNERTSYSLTGVIY